MVRRIKKGFIDWLHNAHPVALLSIPFLVCGSIAIFLLATLPLAGTVKYFFFAALFGATIFSKMLQAWEFGSEVFHFIIFCFAFTYGPMAGILFSVATSLITIFSAIFVGGHMYNHSVPGPIFQSIDTLLLAILAGLAGIIAPNFVMENLTVAGLAIILPGAFLEKFFAHKVIGLEIGRLASSMAIGMVINYNLLLVAGPKLLEMMVSFM